MDANRRAAPRTGPPGLLLLDKAPQAVGFYAPQVFNHAHAVLRAISLVQLTESLARKARTAGAEIPASRLAILDPAGDAGLGFASIVAPATRASIPASQKGVAEAAIHAARGNEGRLAQT